MTQVQVRELFERVVAGPEPALDLDAWQAVREGRGLIRRRRRNAVLGAAAVVLVVTAVPVGVTYFHNGSSPDHSVPPASQQVSPTQSQSPSVSPSPSSPAPSAGVSSSGHSSPTAAALPAVVLPTDTYLTTQVITWVKDAVGVTLEESSRCDCGLVGQASALTQQPQGQGNEAVQANVSAPSTDSPVDQCPALLDAVKDGTCDRSGYRGLRVFTVATPSHGKTPRKVVYQVLLRRGDGALVSASSQGDTSGVALNLAQTRALALRLADFYLFGGGENRIPRLVPPTPAKLATDVEQLTAAQGSKHWTIDSDPPLPGDMTGHSWTSTDGHLQVQVSGAGVLGDYCKGYLQAEPESTCTESQHDGFDVFTSHSPTGGTSTGRVVYSVTVRRADGANVLVSSEGAPLTLAETQALALSLAATYL